MTQRFKKDNHWQYPGEKVFVKGWESLSEAELLAILIGTGIKGHSAESIGQAIINKFDSFKGMANQPLKKFLKIKGLGDAKIIRIGAAFEIARRIVKQVKEMEG